MTTRAKMGPQKIWESETEVEKEANNTILKVINENIVAEVQKKRSQATIYGIPEYELLRAKNAEIDAHNAEHREAGLGRKGRKQRYTAQRLFKQEELEKRGRKRGIEGFRY